MSTIFVNTDNSHHHKKIYNAEKMGKSAHAVEKKMKEVVTAIVAKTAGFTTDKSVSKKGYTLRIVVTKAKTSGHATTYTLHPEIVRYPPSTGKGGKGSEMVPTRTTDPSITLEGASEADLVDAVGEVTTGITKQALLVMKIDMARR